jgi:predicted transcriptional regulator YdeE
MKGKCKMNSQEQLVMAVHFTFFILHFSFFLLPYIMKIQLPDFTLAGIQLEHPTRNAHGQSMADCGSLWERFMKESIALKIPEKFSETIYAVYFNYSGDHNDPYNYFIGCQVPEATTAKDGLSVINVPAARYTKFIAKGKIPDCIASTWNNIWKSKIQRAYIADFEVYDERSSDWESGEVDIFLS